jgi:hypothetical protein
MTINTFMGVIEISKAFFMKAKVRAEIFSCKKVFDFKKTKSDPILNFFQGA